MWTKTSGDGEKEDETLLSAHMHRSAVLLALLSTLTPVTLETVGNTRLMSTSPSSVFLSYRSAVWGGGVMALFQLLHLSDLIPEHE